MGRPGKISGLADQLICHAHIEFEEPQSIVMDGDLQDYPEDIKVVEEIMNKENHE